MIDRRRIFGILAGFVATPALAQTGLSRMTAYAFSFGGLKGGDIKLADYAGKPILVVNTASQCGFTPQYTALEAVYKKYKDKGLVVIGVCHPQGVEKMAAMAKDKGITYPVTGDKDGATNQSYKVNSYPDYYFIDRSGKLRIADCANDKIGEAIEALLAEETAVAQK